MTTIFDTDLKLPLFGKGKVRDTYVAGDKLLIVATDRISAFDSVLPTAIPDKGIVLNQISAFWFGKTYHVVHNHMIESIESNRALVKIRAGKKATAPDANGPLNGSIESGSNTGRMRCARVSGWLSLVRI